MADATSLRVPTETRQGFDELAQLSGRTRSELMIEALDQYLEAKKQRIALIHEGERALTAGIVLNHIDLIAQLKKRGMLRVDYAPSAESADD